MSCGTENVKIEPMEVYLGADAALVQTITCVESTAAASLNNKYFILYSTTTRYLVWFDVNSTGTDPALSGYTSIEVSLGANPQTAAQVATAVQTALDAHAAFVATVSGKVVTCTNAVTGFAYFGHDSQTQETGFAFAVTTIGDVFEKVGMIDGDIEMGGLSRTPVDITSHQTGATVLGQILTGAGNPEISFALKEVTQTRYEKILRYSSHGFYPVANASTAGMGGGSYGQFGSPKSVQVVLHPVRLGIADKTNDYCFWKCTLDLDSVTFSGENVITLPVVAKAFQDCTKVANVNVWMYGDWSQSFAV
jgi:hypothetical protein